MLGNPLQIVVRTTRTIIRFVLVYTSTATEYEDMSSTVFLILSGPQFDGYPMCE